MKMYQVIGGQYESVWYGESDTLLGAMRIATKHEEYWDNWQGWHKPSIYLAENTKDIVSNGRITTNDGITVRIPCGEACAIYSNGKWNKKNILTNFNCYDIMQS